MGFPLKSNSVKLPDRLSERSRRPPLSLPVSVAVVGVASGEQLKANIAVVREAKPMTLTERHKPERLLA
jgi:hypothetical protein